MNHPAKHKLFSFVVFIALAVLAVSSSEARTKLLDKWENEDAPPHKPEKTALIVVLPDGLIREAVERDMAKIISTKDREVIPGSKLPGMYGGIRGKINTEKATQALIDAGMDGVIVCFYSGGGISGEYQRSDYWAEYVGTYTGWAGYAWGTPYFTNVYVIQQGPGYTDFQRTAIVESSYYDLKTKQPVWRIVTETKDTEHSDAAKEIGKKIKSQMKSSRL